jgi:GNAT superfamily N-acetyltransferase
MLRFTWNSRQLTPAMYVEWLNSCYLGGWTERLFQWYLNRRFAGRGPDLLVAREMGEPVSGCGVNYRRVRIPGGAVRDAAIISAAWTLPGARGKGYFTKVAQESARHAADRGCELVLGFVTADNPSGRAMASCGSALLPSAYLTLDSASPPPPHELPEIRQAQAADAARRFASGGGNDSFQYPSRDAWEHQFLERPNPVEILRIGGDSLAVVEHTPDTDRLQWLSCDGGGSSDAVAALARRAFEAGRRFFAFGMRRWSEACAARAGLAREPGYLTCMPLRGSPNPDNYFAGDWNVHSGDRM